MRRRAAWGWVAATVATAVAWCAPAQAAQVSGSLRVTQTGPTTVSFTFTAKRTCTDGEQCDYFSEIDQLTDNAPCPAGQPSDPWILWTGDVQNTGPTTETGQATPRGWAASTGPTTQTRLCLYTFADGTYYLVDDALIGPAPAGGPPPGRSPTGGTGPGGGSSPTGGAGSTADACARYRYQQVAQAALERDPKLAGLLDRNGNGIACESRPKRKTYISTVGMREAATATRAALRKARGAAFTRGTGYRARCTRTHRTRVRCAVSWRHDGRWTGYVDVIGALHKNRRIVVTHIHLIRPFRPPTAAAGV